MKEMKQLFVYTISGLLLLLTSGGCRQDGTEEETLPGGTARITVADGVSASSGTYRLYSFAADGSVKKLDTAFRPGALVEVETGGHVHLSAISGRGSLVFPAGDASFPDFAIGAKTSDDGVVTDTIPALFTAVSAVEVGQTYRLGLACRTAEVRFNVTGPGVAITRKLSFTLTNMPVRVDAAGLPLPAGGQTVSLPAVLTKDVAGTAFTTGFNCFPVAHPEFTYVIEAELDGRTMEGTFSLPPLEAGKSYAIGLLLNERHITLEQVAINDWNAGDTITGGEAH